jgi:bacterial/archaeal transporter family protein
VSPSTTPRAAWAPFLAVYVGCTGLAAGVWKYAGLATAAFCVIYTLAKTVVLWGAWLRWGRGPLLDRARGRFAAAAILTGVLNGLAWIAYLFAFQRGPLAVVQTVTATSSAVAVVLAAVFLRERVGPAQGAGILMVIVASLLLGYADAGTGGGSPQRGWLVASFATAALWGACSALAKYAYGLPGAGDIRMNLGQWLGFVLTVLPYGLWLAPSEPWFPGGAGLASLVVLLYLIGEVGVFAAIRRGPSAVVNALAGLYPIPAIVFMGLMRGDWPRGSSWLAIALALPGTALAVTAGRTSPLDGWKNHGNPS